MDRIQITSGATRLSQLSIRQAGDDVLISRGDWSLVVEDEFRSHVTASDFIFG